MPVQIVRVATSFDEVEQQQGGVTVGFKLISKFVEALIQLLEQLGHVVVKLGH